ncbi:ABC transporter substrate-binding protein [Leucobacter sp. HY1910]
MNTNSTLRTRLGAVILSVTLATTLASCAPAAKSEGGNAQTSQSAITVGMVGSSSDVLQPYAQQGSVSGGAVYDQLYEGLAATNGDGELVYKLAESIEPGDSLDEWTIKLREGVKLHNGEDFTAEDVVESINWMIDPENAWAFAKYLDFMTPESMEIVDDHTINLHLDEPYGLVRQMFSMDRILMRSLKGASVDEPVGTGPFKIESFAPGQQTVVTKFDDYWGDPATLDTVTFTFFQDQQAVSNAIRGGQIDVAHGIAFPDIPALQETPGLDTLVHETAATPLVGMRVDTTPTDDPRVREAIRLAVDRDLIVENAFGGFASVANDFIGKNTACPTPDVPQRKQDLEAAKKLLAEAGAEDIELEIVTDGALPGMSEMAQLITGDVSKLGIKTTVRKLDVATFLDQWLEWPFYVGHTSSPYFVTATGHFSPGGSENGTHFDDSEYNELVKKLSATADEAEQCGYITQMQQIEHERGGYIVPIYAKKVTVFSDKVDGLQPDLYGRSAWRLDGVTVEN